MRITIVTGFFLPVPPVMGGATEKIWYGLARLFAQEGHSVTFVSRTWPTLPRRGRDGGIEHVRVAGFNHTAFLPLNALLDLIWGMRVTRVLPPADAVICNTIALPVWLRLLRPSAGLVAVMIGRTPRGQVSLYRSVSRIYVPSSSVMRAIGARSPRAPTAVTGYPIDYPLLSGSSAQSGSPVTIGFVGRLHPEKGIALLLEAARLLAASRGLPPWRLAILGPSSVSEGGGGEAWLSGLRRESEADLGDRVDWHAPEFDARRLAGFYGGLDIFCYPSLAERGETFGVAVAEAMAAGCAAVVSGLDCFRDLVEDGVTGLAFDHGAPDAGRRLAAALGTLVSDAGRRREIAGRGQAHARRFDYPQVARRILDDLALLTGEPRENRK